MAAHNPKEGAREKAGWGLPVPAPAGTRAAERVADDLFAAPKAGAGDPDPVASLFQDNRALPAPSIAEQPSEAEITRWNATTRASLFDESVPDPVPSAPNPVNASRAANPANALSAPPPVPAGARKAAQPSAPLPPVPDSRSPAAHSAPPLAAAAPSSPPAEGSPSRKRRIERGPKRSVLAAVGVAAVLTLGSAAVVLRLIPNPLAPPPPADTSPARPHAPAVPVLPAPPMAVPVHGFKPAPVPAPPPVAAAPAAATAEAIAAQPAAPAAVPVATAPAVAATPAATPKVVEAPKAQSKSPAVAAPAVVAAPVVVAAAAPARAAKIEPAQDAAQSDAAETSSGDAQNQRLIAAANKKLAEDDPKAAEALMREALAHDPEDHHAMEALVRALIDQDRGADAIPYARKMVKRRSKRVPYRLLLGDALLMTGDENGAHREWKTALELEPNNRQTRLRLGL